MYCVYACINIYVFSLNRRRPRLKREEELCSPSILLCVRTQRFMFRTKADILPAALGQNVILSYDVSSGIHITSCE